MANPQSGTAHVAGTTLVHPIETFKDAVQMLAADPRPLSLMMNSTLSKPEMASIHTLPPFRGGVLNAVIHQIDGYLPEQLSIALYDYGTINVVFQRNISFLRLTLQN